ncbi:MAG: hypothetical protein E6Y21_12635, partial [Cutibacterium avidum]|nr:hypothetical protein [Cutibacterium avidum]
LPSAQQVAEAALPSAINITDAPDGTAAPEDTTPRARKPRAPRKPRQPRIGEDQGNPLDKLEDQEQEGSQAA